MIECCAPLAAEVLSDEEAAATADLFRALADPARVRIVNLLASAGEPVPTRPEDGELAVGLSGNAMLVFRGSDLREADPEILRASREALECDVCLVVGTSAVVYPAAGLVLEAGRLGAFTAEINPEPTEIGGELDLAIAGRAEEVLDEVERLLA